MSGISLKINNTWLTLVIKYFSVILFPRLQSKEMLMNLMWIKSFKNKFGRLQCMLAYWSKEISSAFFFFFFLIFIYLFIWLHQVLAAVGGLLSCGMWTLSSSMHVGSSSLTRDQTRTPCTGSVESYPLRHQGSPIFSFLKILWLSNFY